MRNRKTDQIKWTFDERVDWERRQSEFFKPAPPHEIAQANQNRLSIPVTVQAPVQRRSIG